MDLQEIVRDRYHREIKDCSEEELYYALLALTKKMAGKREKSGEKKKLYYISAEFLVGKMLSNNLINLGIYAQLKRDLEEHGKCLA